MATPQKECGWALGAARAAGAGHLCVRDSLGRLGRATPERHRGSLWPRGRSPSWLFRLGLELGCRAEQGGGGELQDVDLGAIISSVHDDIFPPFEAKSPKKASKVTTADKMAQMAVVPSSPAAETVPYDRDGS